MVDDCIKTHVNLDTVLYKFHKKLNLMCLWKNDKYNLNNNISNVQQNVFPPKICLKDKDEEG